MFSRKVHVSLALTIAALASPTAAVRAADLGTTLNNMFSVHGFGTLGAVHSNEHLADFTSSLVEPNGAGYTRDWSAAVDSLLGLQLDAKFLPQLSAVVQVIAQQQYDNSYRPGLEWANLKYQPIPDFDVRVGRIVLPIYEAAEYRRVGYANPWVRPPIDVYGMDPVTHGDGIDASYRLNVGDFIDTVQGYYGRNNTRFPNMSFGAITGRDLKGFADTAEYGHLSVRAAYVSIRITSVLANAFLDQFRLLGPQGIAIAQAYDVKDKPVIAKVLGVDYDAGRWFAMGEWNHEVTNFFLGSELGWYISSGYRVWQLTPYVVYSERKTDAAPYRGVSLSSLPPSQMALAAGLNGGLAGLLAIKPTEQTASVGARWDFYKDVDVKLQYDHVRLGPGSNGILINLQPGFRPGSTVSLISATVDYVF